MSGVTRKECMDVTQCSEQEYLAGKHLPTGEAVLHTLVLKQAKVRTGFFRSRKVDGHVLILTDRHLINLEWDTALNGYYAIFRLPYNELMAFELFANKQTLLITAKGPGVVLYRIGAAAQQVYDTIVARRGPS